MGITNLNSNTEPKDSLYILDSNVWLPILGIDDEPTSSHYQIFFSKIMKQGKTNILLCPLQISEILNRLLRFHARKLYKRKYKENSGNVPLFSEFYKNEYRSSSDFKIKYDSIVDDLSAYSSSTLIRDVSALNFNRLTNFKAGKLDFNDHYLYLLAKEYNSIIVTHDADFLGLDIEIATYNMRLYKDYKNNIKPL